MHGSNHTEHYRK